MWRSVHGGGSEVVEAVLELELPGLAWFLLCPPGELCVPGLRGQPSASRWREVISGD